MSSPASYRQNENDVTEQSNRESTRALLRTEPTQDPPAPPSMPRTAVAPTAVGAHVPTAWMTAQLRNWRLFLVHVVSSGLSVIITILVLPGFWFERWVWGELLLVAVVAGVSMRP